MDGQQQCEAQGEAAPATSPAVDFDPSSSTEYDPVRGRFVRIDPKRIAARRITLLLVQRHWAFGAVVLILVIIFAPAMRRAVTRPPF